MLQILKGHGLMKVRLRRLIWARLVPQADRTSSRTSSHLSSHLSSRSSSDLLSVSDRSSSPSSRSDSGRFTAIKNHKQKDLKRTPNPAGVPQVPTPGPLPIPPPRVTQSRTVCGEGLGSFSTVSRSSRMGRCLQRRPLSAAHTPGTERLGYGATFWTNI